MKIRAAENHSTANPAITKNRPAVNPDAANPDAMNPDAANPDAANPTSLGHHPAVDSTVAGQTAVEARSLALSQVY